MVVILVEICYNRIDKREKDMLTEELLELTEEIRRGKTESQTLEVKAAHNGCPRRLYDTLSAFSNQDSGGIIVFGLDEQTGFSVVGVYDVQDLQKHVTEQCLQMEPPVRAVFTIAEIEGRIVCSAEIPAVELTERPCYYAGVGRVRGSFVRVGEAVLPMTDLELYSYEAFRQHQHDDERVVERATMDMLDEESVQSYIMERKKGRSAFSRLSPEQINEMLCITGDGVPTLAAVLNFSIFPQGYFPQFCITAIVVPGTEPGAVSEDQVRFINNRRIEGTISQMFEEAMQFCSRSMKVKTIIDPATGKRTDRTEYPMNAVREAILNALIHRDYSVHTEGTPVQIVFFTDRLEIHSPGNLYGRMTIDQLGWSRPDLRNPTLAVMAEALTSAENRYSGIPTIRREMAGYGLPEPVFENRRNEFVVTLYNGESSASIIDDSLIDRDIMTTDGLIEFCRKPRSRQEIADFLGVRTINYAVNRYIRPLISEGRLQMMNPDKPRSRYQKYYSL